MIIGNTNATNLLLSNLTQYNLNPSNVIQNTLDVLGMALGGQDIVDVTNPAIFLIEAGCTNVAGAIMSTETVSRRLYPLLAQTPSDLYYHMSDSDYIGIYSTGATSTVEILLPYQQLLQNAIYINNSTSVKTVVIPRDTQITVNGITLGIAYPININVLDGTVVQIEYDTSIISPLYTLSSNILDSTIYLYQGVQFLKITVPVIQYTNVSYIYSINTAAEFSMPINFVNSYFYTRVYYNNGTGSWIEAQTTFSPRVYDITVVTFLLSVVGQVLTVTLPDIYQTLNLAGTSVRIDVFTSQGAMDVDLSQIPMANFSAVWQDFDTLNINPGVAPLNNINDILMFSTDTLIGGSNALTTDQIRQRVIYHTNSTVAPVRPSDLNIGLGGLGYSVQKIIDSVTNRVFLASKNLPTRLVNGLSTTPLFCNNVVNFNLSEGLTGGGFTKSIVTQTAPRSTVLPTAIYSIVNGNVTLLSDTQITTLQNLVPGSTVTGNSLVTMNTNLVTAINNNFYMYSPFHYVLDYTSSVFTVRPYYLQNPIVYGSNSIGFNTNRNYNISTLSSSISLVNGDFILTLNATIPSNITGVMCQITYTSPSGGNVVYLNSVPSVGVNTATFTFTLSTNFDINEVDQIEIVNMVNAIDTTSPIFINLVGTFNVFYLVAGSNTGLETTFDNLYLVTPDMPSDVIGATYETITVTFGYSLPNLYSYSNVLLSPKVYQTYSAVVNAIYTETIYQTDTNGNYVFTENTISVNAGAFIPNTVYEITTLGTTNWSLIGWTTANSLTGITTPLAGDSFLATGIGSGTGVASTGIVSFTVANAIGDPVLSGGLPVILHNIGDLILDTNGNPIPVTGSLNSTVYQVGISMLDAKYLFATAPVTVSYVNSIPSTVIGFLNNEIIPAAQQLYERTELYYTPVGESYQLNVLIGNGVSITVSSLLNIQITFLLLPTSVNNTTITSNISTITRDIISNNISLPTISEMVFREQLSAALPPDVISYQINSFLPNGYSVVTLSDATKTFNIGQVLAVMPDGSLDVIDQTNLIYSSYL